MKCVSCREEYASRDAGTCRECYEEASETEEELKREIEDLKAKVAFLRFSSWTPHQHQRPTPPCFTDVVLVASDDDNPVPVPAHKAVLVSTIFPRLPFFVGMVYGLMGFYLFVRSLDIV